MVIDCILFENNTNYANEIVGKMWAKKKSNK